MHHPELDGVVGAIRSVEDDTGDEVVLVLHKPPKPHVQRLMDTLGVRIVVEPVSRQQDTYALRGRADQDYRESHARALRRADAGEVFLACEECGCELDRTPASHDPKCTHGKTLHAPTAEPGPRGLERGSSGHKVSTAPHVQVNGRDTAELTVGEQERRHRDVIADSEMTVGCTVPGCDWPGFTGSSREATRKSGEHRAAAHPELVTPEWRRPPAGGRTVSEEEIEAQRAALEDMANGGAEAGEVEGEPQSTSSPHDSASVEIAVASDYRQIDADGRWGCKIEGCVGRSSASRGAAAYLCDDVHGPAKREANRLAVTEGLQRKREAGGGVAPIVQEATATWHIAVPGTGLRYRSPEEAYVAAEEIEHDGERVARETRVAGLEEKADRAIDASRELAEKIRVAARLAGGELETKSNSDEDEAPPAAEGEVVTVTSEPVIELPTVYVADAPPEPVQELVVREEVAAGPEWSLAFTGDFAGNAAKVRAEAATLRQQADALDAIAVALDALEKSVRP